MPARAATMAAFGPAGAEVTELVVGEGCEDCRGTGFLGRTGIYELFSMADDLRVEMQPRRGSGRLRSLALERGMVSLRADGLRLVAQGLTTPEEVLRITE